MTAAFLIISHKSRHIFPVAEIAGGGVLAQHTPRGVLDGLVHRKLRLRGSGHGETSHRNINGGPHAIRSLVRIQQTKKVIIGFKMLLMGIRCALEIRNIQLTIPLYATIVVRRTAEKQQILGLCGGGTLINHPHIVADGAHILLTAGELVIHLLRSDHLHRKTVIGAAEVRQTLGL